MRGVTPETTRSLIQPGETAPDFDLPVLVGGVKKRFHLCEQLEKGCVVLAFYPVNWESVSAANWPNTRRNTPALFPEQKSWASAWIPS